MMLRSWLFVPGDSEKKLAKTDSCGADAIILDLEDSVVTGRKQAAREMIADFLGKHAPEDRKAALWVRINPLNDSAALTDLNAVMPGAPSGIVLPKASGPEDVARLSQHLDDLEADSGITTGTVKIMPIATETASAPFRLGDYASADLPRLDGMTWGAEDLSSAIGASTNRDANGEWAFTYKMVRSMMLLAARAAGVQPIETLYIDYRDPEGLLASCRAARAEGFSGRLAIHPAQVDIINKAFVPTEAEAALARKIVAAFAAEPGAGTIGMDGKMFDLPHLEQARKTLAVYEAYVDK